MYLWWLNQGSRAGDPTACEKLRLPGVWCLTSSAVLWEVSPQADGLVLEWILQAQKLLVLHLGFGCFVGSLRLLTHCCGWLCPLVPVPCRKPVWHPVTSAEIPVSLPLNAFVTNTEYFNKHISGETNQLTNQTEKNKNQMLFDYKYIILHFSF